MRRTLIIGAQTGKRIAILEGDDRSNVYSVNFRPIDDSLTVYATALCPMHVREERRKQAKQAKRVAGGAS